MVWPTPREREGLARSVGGRVGPPPSPPERPLEWRVRICVVTAPTQSRGVWFHLMLFIAFAHVRPPRHAAQRERLTASAAPSRAQGWAHTPASCTLSGWTPLM